MKKVNIHFNIHSLLYNNDPDAIEALKQLGEYETYKSYDKEVERKIVNKITLNINDDDTIDYIKRKLSLELFEKIKNKKDQKTCFYCFRDHNDAGKKNEIIELKEDKEDVEDDLFKDFKIKKKEDIEDDDLDDINLDDLSDFEDEDEDSESLASINLSEILEGAGKKKKQK